MSTKWDRRPLDPSFRPGRSFRRSWRQWTHTSRQRWMLGIVALIIFLFLFSYTRPGKIYIWKIILAVPSFIGHLLVDLDQPPTYEKLRIWEANLPQHDLNLPFPEGGTGRYVYFANEIIKSGWNNKLNELLMNSFLAYKSERAYVFQEFVWESKHYPWPYYKFRDWIPRTPLNALISGPTAGGPWDPADDAPRSVSAPYFNEVCPKSERRIINTQGVKPAIKWSEGDLIFNHWQKLLKEAPERCIEIQMPEEKVDPYGQVFDLYLWGSERILSLWEEFKKSPVSRLLATSPIVHSAIVRNEYLLLPRGPRPEERVPANPYNRMLAIHIRRGDFQEACQSLARWNATFYSWNLHPSLPDKFVVPPGGEWGKNTLENIAIYAERCYPTDDFILEKIRRAREDYVRAGKVGENRHLDTLFLLTNDKTKWLDEFKKSLQKDGWHTIVTTRDLDLDMEQKDVGMAVDMEFARKAAVFVGNGWSSFTSNIVHRRLVDGREPVSIRFY